MKTMKRFIALLSISVLIITLSPQALTGKVTYAASPGSFYFYSSDNADPQAGPTNNMATLSLVVPNATIPNNASTTYTLKNSLGATLDTVSVSDTWMMGQTELPAVMVNPDETVPANEEWFIVFDAQYDLKTVGYTIDVNWEGNTPSTGNIVYSYEGFIATDEQILSAQEPYLFEMGSQNGFTANQIGLWYPMAFDPSSLTYTTGGALSSSLEISTTLLDWTENTVFVLTFGGDKSFVEGGTFAIDGVGSFTINSFATFQADVATVNAIDSGGGQPQGCSGFCVNTMTLQADADNKVNSVKVDFLGGPVSEAELETLTNYKTGMPSNWGDGIVSATAPDSCLSNGNYTCVIVKTSAYLDGFSYFNVRDGADGIQNISSSNLNSAMVSGFTWTYANGSPRVLRVSGWDNEYPKYTNPSGKVLYVGYLNGVIVWMVSPTFQASEGILLYGPNSAGNDSDPSGTYYSDTARTVEAATLADSGNNTYTMTGASDGTLNGVYGNKTIMYSDSISVYFAGTPGSMDKANTYTFTIPSGPRAGAYNPNTVQVFGSKAQLSFTATNGKGFFSGADALGAASYTLGVSNVSETITMSPATNSTYTRDGETLIWSAAQESVSVSVAATDNAAAEAMQATSSYTITRTGSTSGALTVNFSMSGTSTGGGTDYSLATPAGAVTTSAIIPDGQASVVVTLTPVDELITAEPTETAILTVTSGTGYTVGTPSAATINIADNEASVVTVLATDDASSEASQATGTFTITRIGTLVGAITVGYTIGGDATIGTDYALTAGGTPAPNSATILDGQSSVAVTLTPTDDSSIEGAEGATLSISMGAGYSVGNPSSATIYLSDNDLQQVVVMASDSFASETGPGTGTFSLSRAPNSTGDLTVNFTMSGTAVGGGTDYSLSVGGSPVTTQATIPNGQGSVNITLTPVDDASAESAETAILTINSGDGYSVGSSPNDAATVTISDNDSSDTVVTITNIFPSSELQANPGKFSVSRTGVTTDSLVVSIQQPSGTASYGADYTCNITNGTLTIPAGQSSAILSCTPIDDETDEGTETIVLTLNSADDYSAGTPGSASMPLLDDDSATENTITVTSADNTAEEATPTTNTATYTFSRSGGTNGIAVAFSLSGTATRDTDYTLSSGSNVLSTNVVYIPANQNSTSITLSPVDDETGEAQETAIVTLTAANGYTVGTPSSAQTTIAESDGGAVPEGPSLTIRGYGPFNGQTGIFPSMALIDVFFSGNPSSESVTFPLSNQAQNAPIQILTGGTPISGQWISTLEGDYGNDTFYRVVYSGSLLASTSYTVKILKTFATSGLIEEANMQALTDGGTYYSFTFTTGTGAGSYEPGGSYSGQHGGQIPPLASLGYPQPGSTVPYNIQALNVQFDRAMDATTFAEHIYVKKNVNGTLTDPPGTLSLSPTTGTSNSVRISGYNFANSNANCNYQTNCSWVVVVTRDVKDTKGVAIAGMPLDAQGNTVNTGGFGYENMGPFKENFYTSYSAQSQNVTANLMATSLDQYRSGAGTTGVPTSMVLSASFSNALDTATVTTGNVKVKLNGTPIAGTVSYDSMNNMIKFRPTSALTANTEYEFSISTSVKSVSNTSITAVSKTFTTGGADNVAPKLVYAEANNYGLNMQFSEQLNSEKATNKANYTLKTCASGAISSDGTTCPGGGSPATVSLLSANLNYETYDGISTVRMDGLTLTSDYGFFIQVSTNVTDVANNAMSGSNRSNTGFVIDCSKTQGGQCQYEMGGVMSVDQFDMKGQMMDPVRIEPATTRPGALSKYKVEFTTLDQIASGSLVLISLPQGTNVSGAKRDTSSQRNSDFNGGGTGTITFASSDSTYGNATSGGANNDGIAVITEVSKIVVKLTVSGGGSIASGDHISFDLDGIVNTTTGNSTGFSVSIDILDSTGKLIRNLPAMSVPISAAGESSLGGRITNSVSGAGLNGVTLFFENQNGLVKTTTANNANGGGQDGEYKFSNLQNNMRGFLHTDMSLSVSGTPYSIAGEEVFITGSATKNFSLTPDTGGAVLPVTIIANDLASIDNLGIDDSIHVFRMIMTSSNGGQGKAYTLTRSDITGGTTVHNINISQAGLWNVGVGPAVSNDSTQMPETDWVSDNPSMMVTVTANDVSQGTTLSGITFTISAITAENGAEVTGKVVDMADTALGDYKIIASRPQNNTFKVGPEPNTNTDSSGAFTLKLENGEYEVRAEKGGFPGAYAHVSVRNGDVYTNWSATESTGASGNNPFILRSPVNTSSCFSVSGRVTDGTNPITGALINVYKSGGTPSPSLSPRTDGLGNYGLCVPAGTWVLEAYGPSGGNYIGSKTLDVTADLGSQDFEPSGDIGSISGTVSVPGTDDDSGIIVMAHSASGASSATTATNGTYTISGLPYSGAGTSYILEIMKPGSWSLKEQTVTVNGDETGSNFSVPTLSPVTITLSSAVTTETGIEFHDGTNVRNAHVTIFPGQTSTTTSIPQDTYYLDMFIPGVQKSSLTITGAAYSSASGTAVVDGTESISITMPTLYTVSGTVTNPASATVNAWVQFSKRGSYEPPVGVSTSSDGIYSIKLAAGTYEVTANTPGAYTSPVALTVSANSANNNFTLTSYNRTISGTVTRSGGGVLTSASVWAIKNGGGFSKAEVDNQNSTYSLKVSDGTWTVYAGSDGYAQGTPQQVVVSGGNQSNKNFSLTALSGGDVLKPPKMGLMNPSSGGMMVDTDARVRLNVPANALGSGTSSAQLTAQETNDVASTSIGTPLGGKGKEFSATDSTGTPITSFSNEVEIELEYLVSELNDGDITTSAQVEQIANAYWDDTLGNWVTLATTRTYNDGDGDAIAVADVESDLGNVTSVTFKSKTTHFTTFAPIIPSGVTPPATPAGLQGTAGDTSITLTWTANSEEDMDHYNIWEANVTEGVLTTLAHASCTGGTCSKAVTGLTNGTLYTFQIIAVDTESNESAGSTSVSVTPVAPAAPVQQPSGGGGAVIITNTEKVDQNKVAEEITTFIIDTIKEKVDLTNAGKVPANVAIQSKDSTVAVIFTQDTTVIDENGKSYSKGIPSPTLVASPASPPQGKAIFGDAYEIGVKGTKLFFSKAITLHIDVPDTAVEKDNLKVYYYDDDNSKWVMAEDGGTLKKDANGNAYMEVKVYHMTKFAVMKDTGTTTPFADIGNHWAKAYIEQLYDLKVVTGSTVSSFAPDKPVTRAELVKMIILAYNITLPEAKADSIYKDVSDDSWYSPYISKANEIGMVNGYSDGTFKPNSSVTRAEAMKMLFTGGNLNASDKATTPFTDVPVNLWFSKYVLSANKLGIVGGYSDTIFKPNSPVTRGEISKMLSKTMLLKNLRDKLLNITSGTAK